MVGLVGVPVSMPVQSCNLDQPDAWRAVPAREDFLSLMSIRPPQGLQRCDSVPCAEPWNHPYLLWGDGLLAERLCGLEFLISPLSFFQTHPAQTAKLYHAVAEALGALAAP